MTKTKGKHFKKNPLQGSQEIEDYDLKVVEAIRKHDERMKLQKAAREDHARQIIARAKRKRERR